MPPSTIENRIYPDRPAFSQLARFGNYDERGIDISGKIKITEQIGITGKLFYHNHLDDYISYSDLTYQTPIATSTFKDYYTGGSFFTDIRSIDRNVVRTALHYRTDSHKERDDDYLPFAQSLSRTGSVSLEDEVKLSDNFQIVGGIALDWLEVKQAERNNTDDDTGDFTDQETLETGDRVNTFNPLIGAFYMFPAQTKLFGSVAKKTRFPTLQQLFSSRSGNPDLEAERSINYTIGVSRPLQDIAIFEFAFFHHDIKDWISRDGPDPLSLYRNCSAIKMNGFELNTRMFPTNDITVHFGYTYNSAVDHSGERVTDRVVNAPKHKFDHVLSWRESSSGLSFDISGSYMGSVYSQLPTPQNPDDEVLSTDDYYLVNCRLGKTMFDHFEAYLAINNVLDVDYEPEASYPGPGRVYWLGLSIQR
jgi:outer membrane receptor protein involved in Fe transport